MTTPRAHAELAIKYYSDSEMKCWIFEDGDWVELKSPLFSQLRKYHVGKEEPTEPPTPMCELGGVEFPMPESEKPKQGQTFYCPTLAVPDTPYIGTWADQLYHLDGLKSGSIHLNENAAIQHGKALRAANLQAIEKAKGHAK